MEHSVLHALELIGQVIALGGVFLILALVRPAQKSLGQNSGSNELARALHTSAAHWVFRGALLAAAATVLNLFVQVAEVRAKTIFNGVSLPLVAQFATQTIVGRLSLARVIALVLMAAASRGPGQFKWWLTGLLGMTALVLTSSVSHAAAQPVGRLGIMLSQISHVTAAVVWMGVLIQLLLLRSRIEGHAGQTGIPLLAEIVRRFSPIALLVTSLLGLSGLLMIFRLLADPGALVTSAYGLTLIVKLSLLTPAIFAGFINFRVIRPQLNLLAQTGQTAPEPQKASLLRHFGKMLELEVTAGILVITAAGILASVSPPGEAGDYRLTLAQQHAMLHPGIPSVKVVDPATFYGAETRGLDDLQYSEFTHHWSGVMVCLLGLGWLLQSTGGRLGRWAGYGWPFLLVPFAVFVALADPEVWFLHRVSLWRAIGDPQLLEHQLGAAIILVLVWLGWRDHGRPAANRPLGYALPVIFILGGILLLGHAHSTLTITEDVTNLINIQHAVFGAFILFAGAVRWLSLRHLVPRRPANFIWPSLIICLGLFMTFCYRETL